MEELKNIISSSNEMIDYLMYKLLKSNNVCKDKQEIINDFTKIVDEISIETTKAKMQYCVTHNQKMIDYDETNGMLTTPDWSIIFYEKNN